MNRTSQPATNLHPIDFAGTEVYTAHYSERRVLRLAVTALAIVAAIQTAALVLLANKPPVTHYVRIDEVGRATAISYNDLTYTPREGEIRSFLINWATLRYSMLRGSVAKNYSRNYYFVQDHLATQLMAQDLKDRTVAKVMTGQTDENDVQVNNVTFTALGRERIHNVTLYTGGAIIDLFKAFPGAMPPRREHWEVSVTFYLNPDEVSRRSANFPQFETINPLGLVITDFHEARAIQ
jgi:type IV secretion system protein VirB5